ncbi:Uncharacterized protein OS=Thiorhodovibrio sp. 970 GN=Thi970DRAFT_00617 PE=4 SV=1 [Gemmataceae bacterium]|nr:Uncharacterized protein OS=Thiorhodovibrio sp. 970 GN=Thi970DRAFT_00617 PE=4 SV=1 [Gemmataceae bacterium]VTU00981.1 Uncharacterized protein OS=Thiorhodovibrio sp. 970 GN=Thi970DRAFT_00617 PE=4 SV=1 [Gemmataceae bacterium]
MAFDLFGSPAGFAPPHPAIEPRLLRLFERAILHAWHLVRTAPPSRFNLSAATEDQITAVLHNTLVNRVLFARAVRGFTPDLFRVAREPKVWTYNESSLDKMPDLFFYLINERSVAFPDQDGLFVECKPVDTRHAVGGHYCDRGLRRFISGEYAWAMREGMMVAYAVNGYVLPGELTTSLAAGNRPTDIPLVRGPNVVPRTAATPYTQRPYTTEHSRAFTYTSGDAPPEILMHHLWLAMS